MKRPESFNDGIFLNRFGPSVDYATFNCLTFIYYLGHHSNLIDNLNILSKDENSPELLNEITNWKIEKSYSLFFNLHFLQEYVNELSILSKSHRDSLGDFASVLFEFLVTNSQKALEIINKRYPFLNFDIDWFMANPIFKYWKENEVKTNAILNIVFDQQTPRVETTFVRRNLINAARNAITRNRKYFTPAPGVTELAIKRAMTRILNTFKEQPDLHRSLLKSRALMDRNFQQGFKEFEETLVRLGNG